MNLLSLKSNNIISNLCRELVCCSAVQSEYSLFHDFIAPFFTKETVYILHSRANCFLKLHKPICTTTDYGHPMKAQIKEIWNFGPMRQTKYALIVPKNLGWGFDFWLCSDGDFLTRRPCAQLFQSLSNRKWKGTIHVLCNQNFGFSYPPLCAYFHYWK